MPAQRVVVVARSRPALEVTAGDLRHDPVIIVADLRDPDAAADIVHEALAALGAVDILVNNAAAAARMPTVETDAGLIDGSWRST